MDLNNYNVWLPSECDNLIAFNKPLLFFTIGLTTKEKLAGAACTIFNKKFIIYEQNKTFGLLGFFLNRMIKMVIYSLLFDANIKQITNKNLTIFIFK